MSKRQYQSYSLFLQCIISLALALGAGLIYRNIQTVFIEKLSICLFFTALIIAGLMLVNWLFSNKIYKGIRYFRYHWQVKNTLEFQMLDAGICIDRGKYFELPQVKLSFDKKCTKGLLKIRNSIKFDKKLDGVVMSSALGKFIVERHYTSDDANYYIYELVDGAISYKLTFKSYKAFKEYNKKIPTYKWFLDKRSIVPLSHALVVGQTGSGKSYFIYLLILQMINKSVDFDLYFVDPKGSSIEVVGDILAPERTAVTLEETIKLLETFVENMRIRKSEVKELLKTKLDSDYSDLGLSPAVMIFDEYASFSALLATEEKKVRDKVKSLLSEVILQGRQLSYFLVVAMQKSDASLIETYLRDNLPLKVCLGNAEQQTIVTCFGTGVDIPARFMNIGDGFFTSPTVANEPKLMMASFCDFDILGAMKASTPVM